MTETPAETTPVRRCCGCRSKLRADGGLRWVATPGGALAIDVRRRAPGRGTHTCARPSCIEQAWRRRAFARTLQAEVEAPGADALVGMAVAALDRQARELLGLLRRSGDLLVGAEAVKAALREGRCALVLVAADASDRTAGDVCRLAGAGDVPALPMGPSEAAGQAIGRPATAIVGAPRGALSDVLATVAQRRHGLTGGRPEERGVLS